MVRLPSHVFYCICFFLSFASQKNFAATLFVQSPNGEVREIAVNPDDRFLDVIEQMADDPYYNKQQRDEVSICASDNGASFEWMLAFADKSVILRAKLELGRDYHAVLSRQQKEDIAFVITTLAWSSAGELFGNKSALRESEERIKDVHPFRFLEIIFTSDKLTAGIAAIKERNLPLVKRTFYKNLTASLETEAQKDNLLPFLDDFTDKIDLDKKKVLPLLKNKQYSAFIDQLIELKPRKDADRHNM